MFYTIISRLPFIVNDNSETKYLKIFIFGSVLHILASYYIHAKAHGEIFEKIKQWHYYMVGGDLIIAGLLTYFMSPTSTTPNSENNGYTPEQIREIQHRMKMAQARDYNKEMAQQRMMEQREPETESKSKDEDHSHKSPFKKKQSNDSEESSNSSLKKREKKQEKQEKPERQEKQDKKQEKKKCKTDESDTYIPIHKEKD